MYKLREKGKVEKKKLHFQDCRRRAIHHRRRKNQTTNEEKERDSVNMPIRSRGKTSAEVESRYGKEGRKGKTKRTD